LQFLEALSRQLQLTIGRLLCLLDERMQYHNASSDQEAVEGTTNA
jgi:hypothetical protein